MKKGLILEGGAMRGLFTAGILDVLLENDLLPDGAIGVSAGAAFGCNLKSLQHGRPLRYNTRFAKDPRYASFLSLILTGDMYNSHFDYERIPHELDPFDEKTFKENPMEFYCVATDAVTGRALYHKCSTGNTADLKWIQGSASIPMAARPVNVDGFSLLDGGVSDSIPLTFFENIGYERNIVILTQPKEYRKEPFDDKLLEIYKIFLHKTPLIYERIRDRYQRYNECTAMIRRKEENNEVLVIRPAEALNIGSVCHDPDEMRRVYEIGRRAAYDNLERIREWWKEE